MLTFTYEYSGGHLAKAHISDGQSDLTIYSSLITGGNLDHLAERVLVLLKMDRADLPAKERCSWGDEPGEYRWVLESAGGTVKIQVLFFEEAYSRLLDERGRLLFSTQASLLKFANQVRVALRDNLAALGPDEYRNRAGSDFPQRIYDELSSIIREEQIKQKATRQRK
jgi:hypothetical protein